jgi:hypothetical protein
VSSTGVLTARERGEKVTQPPTIAARSALQGVLEVQLPAEDVEHDAHVQAEDGERERGRGDAREGEHLEILPGFQLVLRGDRARRRGAENAKLRGQVEVTLQRVLQARHHRGQRRVVADALHAREVRLQVVLRAPRLRVQLFRSVVIQHLRSKRKEKKTQEEGEGEVRKPPQVFTLGWGDSRPSAHETSGDERYRDGARRESYTGLDVRGRGFFTFIFVLTYHAHAPTALVAASVLAAADDELYADMSSS